MKLSGKLLSDYDGFLFEWVSELIVGLKSQVNTEVIGRPVFENLQVHISDLFTINKFFSS